MRRKDREVKSFAEIVEIMRRCEVCHVGFHDADYPYVAPMNFGLQVEEQNQQVTLYFHGAQEGRKHDLLKINNRVGFAMEVIQGLAAGPTGRACGCSMNYQCVMGAGVMEYIEDPAEKLKAMRHILGQYKVSADELDSHILSKTAVYRLAVHSLSGKIRHSGR